MNPDIINQLAKQFLPTFTGQVLPTRKPQFQDSPPAWQNKITLGAETPALGMRRYTEFRCWIKPPSQRFPKTNLFVSIVNAKSSTFSRLNNLDELKALHTAIGSWLPHIEEKIEELKPLEATLELARQAYDAVANPSENGDEPEEE